jgi:peptidoglycan/xylan/chitin deacetylase (PgdA/CDA1 family)
MTGQDFSQGGQLVSADIFRATRQLVVDYPTGTSWGVCLSHDVDHLGLGEHFVDGFLVRYLARAARDNLLAAFRPRRIARTISGLWQAALGRDPWETIETVLTAERRAGVRSTWFIVTRPGRGVSYGLPDAERAVTMIQSAGHEIGLHGQSADDPAAVADEARALAAISTQPPIGLRMHYLRLTSSVIEGIRPAGIQYDSTMMDRSHSNPADLPIRGPLRLPDGTVEIPLHIMDGTLFSSAAFGLTLDQATEYARIVLNRAAADGRTIVINLHPNYYSSLSPDIRDWYDWLLQDITSRRSVFLTDLRGLAARLVGIDGP